MLTNFDGILVINVGKVSGRGAVAAACSQSIIAAVAVTGIALAITAVAAVAVRGAGALVDLHQILEIIEGVSGSCYGQKIGARIQQSLADRGCGRGLAAAAVACADAAASSSSIGWAFVNVLSTD